MTKISWKITYLKISLESSRDQWVNQLSHRLYVYLLWSLALEVAQSLFVWVWFRLIFLKMRSLANYVAVINFVKQCGYFSKALKPGPSLYPIFDTDTQDNTFKQQSFLYDFTQWRIFLFYWFFVVFIHRLQADSQHTGPANAELLWSYCC